MKVKLNKKIIGIFSLVAVLALAGCGAASDQNDTNPGTDQPQQNEQPSEQPQEGDTTGDNAAGDTTVAFDEAKAQETYQASCAGCHGANLEGGFGPALDKAGSTMDANAIFDIIKNGRGQMPPQGQVSDEDAKNVAEWLASLK